MTVDQVIQLVMGGGMVTQGVMILKWVIRVETRLAVMAAQLANKP